jgi:hypothetical protein
VVDPSQQKISDIQAGEEVVIVKKDSLHKDKSNQSE